MKRIALLFLALLGTSAFSAEINQYELDRQHLNELTLKDKALHRQLAIYKQELKQKLTQRPGDNATQRILQDIDNDQAIKTLAQNLTDKVNVEIKELLKRIEGLILRREALGREIGTLQHSILNQKLMQYQRIG